MQCLLSDQEHQKNGHFEDIGCNCISVIILNITSYRKPSWNDFTIIIIRHIKNIPKIDIGTFFYKADIKVDFHSNLHRKEY